MAIGAVLGNLHEAKSAAGKRPRVGVVSGSWHGDECFGLAASRLLSLGFDEDEAVLVVVDAAVRADREGGADPSRRVREPICTAVEFPDHGAVAQFGVGRRDEIAGTESAEPELDTGCEHDRPLLAEVTVGRQGHVRVDPSAVGQLDFDPVPALLREPLDFFRGTIEQPHILVAVSGVGSDQHSLAIGRDVVCAEWTRIRRFAHFL